jgi:hypothetical protein
MAGEDDIARNAAKEFLDRRAADKAAEFAAVPDTASTNRLARPSGS